MDFVGLPKYVCTCWCFSSKETYSNTCSCSVVSMLVNKADCDLPLLFLGVGRFKGFWRFLMKFVSLHAWTSERRDQTPFSLAAAAKCSSFDYLSCLPTLALLARSNPQLVFLPTHCIPAVIPIHPGSYSPWANRGAESLQVMMSGRGNLPVCLPE